MRKESINVRHMSYLGPQIKVRVEPAQSAYEFDFVQELRQDRAVLVLLRSLSAHDALIMTLLQVMDTQLRAAYLSACQVTASLQRPHTAALYPLCCHVQPLGIGACAAIPHASHGAARRVAACAPHVACLLCCRRQSACAWQGGLLGLWLKAPALHTLAAIATVLGCNVAVMQCDYDHGISHHGAVVELCIANSLRRPRAD